MTMMCLCSVLCGVVGEPAAAKKVNPITAVIDFLVSSLPIVLSYYYHMLNPSTFAPRLKMSFDKRILMESSV